MTPVERETYRRFATLLTYPTAELTDAAWACAALLDAAHPEAARLVQSFAAFVEATPPGRLEEMYSGTFELDAAAPPYVGHHLFGESYKRSVFLLRLRAACRHAGVDPGTELPDHLAILLRLLAASADDELRDELVEAALLPAIEAMTKEDAAARDGYGLVLHALRLVLAARVPTERSA